jgi:ferric-dicitrate binding protein FerR (iron transport regulator)
LEDENLIPDQPARILKLNWYQWAAAASIVLLLGISTFLIMQKQNKVYSSMNTIVASSVQQIILTDGSTVNLNKGTSLTYPENITTPSEK